MALTIEASKFKVTSDTHWGHSNVIKYCNRPFKDCEEMDEAMIKRWNEKVNPGDTVLHVGDFSFHRPEVTKKIISRLNGQIHLVAGNHDKLTIKGCKDSFASVRDLREIKVIDGTNTQRIMLCHYALRVWKGSHHGVWNLYGHSHGSLSDDNTLLSMDVGVDTNNFYPYTFDQIKQRMANKTWKPVDHHGTRTGDDGQVY